jgi:glycosyltransferase involved in cell wall biosynthesis
LIFTNNHGDYLNNCVESVLNQKLDTVSEIIKIYIFNNGENFNLKEEYIQKIKNIFHVRDIKGPSELRNFGLKQTSSDIIFFLDGDDLWHEDKIKNQLKALQKNSEKVIFTDCDSLDAQGKLTKLYKTFYPDRQFYNMIINNMSITGSMSGICLSRNTIKKIEEKFGEVFDENIYYAEDFDFYLKLTFVTSFVKIDKSLVIIVDRYNSYSKSTKDFSIHLIRYKIKLKYLIQNIYKLSILDRIKMICFIKLEFVYRLFQIVYVKLNR